jgi:hypothetical protein
MGQYKLSIRSAVLTATIRTVVAMPASISHPERRRLPRAHRAGKIRGQNAGSQDWDDAVWVGRFPPWRGRWRSFQPLPACGRWSKARPLVYADVEAHHGVSPIAPMAIAAASALDSATITPASTGGITTGTNLTQRLLMLISA